MFAHIWRMRAKKKKAEGYEKFGRQVTLPALKKINGCIDAYFMRVFEARKPEYLWVVLWRDNDALEAARDNPAWKEQIKKFEAGNFYKTIPLELVCESLGSFPTAGAGKSRKATRVEKKEKPAEAEETSAAPQAMPGPTPEGE
jgi:heme-degrading monooxygenase HmoA